MSDNKPLEADSSEQEEGQEDVAGNLSLEELNKIAGREFDSREDFLKHYDNLKSLVGDQKRVQAEKKAQEVEKVTEENLTLAERLSSLEASIEEGRFIDTNPDAKDSLDDLRALAKGKGVSLQEAWESGFKDLVEAKKARESETEIGVNSKNRLNSTEAKKVASLAEKVQSGQASEAERAELIRNWPGAL